MRNDELEEGLNLRQRAFDLRPCDAQPGSPPQVRRDGARWRAALDRTNGGPGELVVEVATGRMWAEELPAKKG